MDWPADQIIRKKTTELIPYEKNPRIHSDEQLAQIADSIKEWGWTIPLVIDEQNNLIAGHGRLEAAKNIGIEEVPCIIAKGWSDQQKRAYVIADNKLAESGYWDTGLYYSELKSLAAEGFDVNLTGVDIDLDQLNFTPNLQPMTSYNDVTDDDMQRADDGINAGFERTSSDVSQKSQEVICPHCANTFRFEGM